MSVYKHFETMQVHAGHKADPATGSCLRPYTRQHPSGSGYGMRRVCSSCGRRIYLFPPVKSHSQCTGGTPGRSGRLFGAVAASSRPGRPFSHYFQSCPARRQFCDFSFPVWRHIPFRDRFRDLGITFRFATGKNLKTYFHL